ncbi:trypsin-like serine protease [Vibrio metschnikovii]
MVSVPPKVWEFIEVSMKHNILSAVIGTLLLSSSPLMASGTDSDDITARIIGGEKAQPNDWPYMAALTRINKNTSFCGGSLISELLRTHGCSLRCR